MLHIDRHDLVQRAPIQDLVLDRKARHGASSAGGPAGASVAATASQATIVDPSVAVAVRAASTSDLASVDQADEFVRSLRANPSSLSGLHDALDASRVRGLLAD